MRNKLHNCKGCLWSGTCVFENTGKIDCKDFTTSNENSYRVQEYNTVLQERSDNYMSIVREMCDEFYDS